MANYIQTLQQDRERLTDEKRAALAQITALKVYLTSAKFHKDTTVQVSDVLDWLEPACADLIE